MRYLTQPAWARRKHSRRCTGNLTRKELDLLLLAGCSCLMTLLSHPIAHAASVQPVASHVRILATQVSMTPLNLSSQFHVLKPTNSAEITEEEDV